MSTSSASQVKDFSERIDAQINQKREKMERMKTQKDLELKKECSFSPKGSRLSRVEKEKEQQAQKAQEEIAAKKAMKMEVPVLNLHKSKIG